MFYDLEELFEQYAMFYALAVLSKSNIITTDMFL